MSDLEIYQRNEIDHYSPQDGLARIAVAESGENFFKRARNSDGLYEAVKTKLTEQRKFIKWYDAQDKAKGGRPSKTCDGSVTGLSLHELFNLSADDDRGHDAVRKMLSRWRKSLASDEAFSCALADAQARCKRICEQEKITTVRGTEGTGEFDLYTPVEYIEAARRVLGEIDLDPASSEIAQRLVMARHYFTIDDDGLKQEWFGRVWMNPPYHRELLPLFVNKLVNEYNAGRVQSAIMLTNNCTDTQWFHEAEEACSAICFTNGRINFYRPNNETVAPTQGQAFFYFGQDVQQFADVFKAIGSGFTPSWFFDIAAYLDAGR
jgi:phage N-6-adenine-methyltransferase